MNGPSYDPTPLEQAYGLYLAQQIFGISPVNINTGVHIPGRNAVPFLTQSGVDRTILRSLWTVADPNNVGSLSSIQQFHLLLRLVAMAQQSMIHPDHTVDDMMTLVSDHATRPLSLPRFNGVMIPQPQESLLTMYGQFLTRTSLLGTVTTTTTIDDAFGGLVEVQDAPLGGLTAVVPEETPVMPTQEQPVVPQPPVPSGAVEHRVSHVSNMSSLSDASFGGDVGGFSDFGTSNNAPLPTLRSMGGSVASNESTSGVGSSRVSVEAANSMSSQGGPMTASTFASTTAAMSETADSSAAMGGFLPTPMPLDAQHQQSMATTATEAITDDDDDDDDDDDFGGFSSAPSTSAEQRNVFSPTGIDTQPSMNGAASVDTHSTMDISDAFGEVGVQDAPLPPLDAFGVAPAPSTATGDDFGAFAAVSPPVPATETTAAISDDEDDFGDFGSATQPTMSGESVSQVSGFATGMMTMPPVATTEQPFVTDMGRAMSEPVAVVQPAVTDTNRSMSTDMDAFGDLGPAQDAPLPRLGVFGAATPGTELPTPKVPDEVDDEFGEFENVASITKDGNDFGDFDIAATKPLPADATETLGGGDLSISTQGLPNAPFGGFGSTALGAPFMTADTPSNNVSPFGGMGATISAPSVTDLERTMSEPVVSSIPQPQSVVQTGRSLSIDDAFDDMPGVQDAPLPSLDAFGSSLMSGPSMERDNTTVEVDDDFGGFEQSVQADITPSQVVSPGSDLPAAELSSFEPPDSSNRAPSADENDFGDFDTSNIPAPEVVSTTANEAAPSVTSLGRTMSEPVQSLSILTPDTDIGRSLSIDDAFGDMAVQDDAPLPSLDMFGATSNQTLEDGNSAEVDDFGDFGQANDAPIDTIGTQQPIDVIREDYFSGFNVAQGETSSTVQPSLLMSEVPSVSDIGRTHSEPYAARPANVLDAGRSLSISDAFYASTTDAKLPGIYGKSEDEGDDFGGFEEAKSSDQDYDDFGGFEEAKSLEEEFDFDGFESSEPANVVNGFGAFDSLAPAPGAVSSDGQDFLSFDAEEITVISGSLVGLPAPTLAPVSADTTDLFGGFGQSVGGAEASAPTTTDEDFGTFADPIIDTIASNTISEKEAVVDDNAGLFDAFNGDGQPSNNYTGAEVDFGAFDTAEVTSRAIGDFQSFESGSQPSTTLKNTISASSNQSDAFTYQQQQSASTATPTTSEVDDFCDFGSAAAPKLEEPSVYQPQMEDVFSSSTVPTMQATSKDVTISNDEDAAADFGDFTAVEATQQATDRGSDDDFGDFGDFSGFEKDNAKSVEPKAPPAAEATSKSFESAEDDDWGDFENVPSPSVTETLSEEIKLRDRIRSLSLQLPESFLLKAGRSGEHVDLGESFEIHTGTNTAMGANQKRRIERCMQVLESLSTVNAKLASTYWLQVFEVILDELKLAATLLADAKTLSSADWKKVETPLMAMMAGLAEYMRVTRSIVASVGDLLLLDESALLTVDTFSSTWGSLTLLEKALAIEKEWKEIGKMSSGTTLKADAVTLADIRSKAPSKTIISAGPTSKLCSLTLQPLSESEQATTKAEVSFEGKCFMACSANLLANRCPFYVVANDR